MQSNCFELNQPTTFEQFAIWNIFRPILISIISICIHYIKPHSKVFQISGMKNKIKEKNPTTNSLLRLNQSKIWNLDASWKTFYHYVRMVSRMELYISHVRRGSAKVTECQTTFYEVKGNKNKTQDSLDNFTKKTPDTKE